jgi:uncharacterized protein YuzE
MEKTMNQETARSIFQAVPSLVGIPARRYWVDYDDEADVLYISFERPQKATDTEMTEDGLLMRYRGEELVGVTVLDASTRAEEIQSAS